MQTPTSACASADASLVPSSPHMAIRRSWACSSQMKRNLFLPQQRIIRRPFCELCKSQMWLACIEPDEPGYDRRPFECPGCPNVTVRIVKYRATGSSPPNQLDAWYSTRQRPLPIRPLTKLQVRHN